MATLVANRLGGPCRFDEPEPTLTPTDPALAGKVGVVTLVIDRPGGPAIKVRVPRFKTDLWDLSQSGTIPSRSPSRGQS